MIGHLLDSLRAFLFRHVFSFLSGATAGDWIRLLWRHRFAVAPRYWPRAALITVATVPNTINRWRELRKYGPSFEEIPVRAPIFILGHWRHGTTHLHNLLSLDDQFAYPYPHDVCYPHAVLCGEGTASGLIPLLIPQVRLQDNIRLSMQDPQEDETALCLATFMSPIMSWVFPAAAAHYDRYMTFRDVPKEEVEKWKAAFTQYMKKLTWKYQRPLILKSPPHTSRIKLLLELFPGARFVHILRDPYTVFLSTVHLEQTAILGMYLQKPRWDELESRILCRYQVMYDAFFEERHLIPDGRYHELKFEELEADPMSQMKAIYESLSLDGFDRFEPRLRQHVDSLAQYRKNSYPRMPEELRLKIRRAWRRSFEAWGYSV